MSELTPEQAADAELRILLHGLRSRNKKYTYSYLTARSHAGRGTVENYVKKVGWSRDPRTLEHILIALEASPQERDAVLELNLRALGGSPRFELSWAARAKAAGCLAWKMTDFTADRAVVHRSIGDPGQDYRLPPYVLRDHDEKLRRDIAAAAAGPLQALILLRGTSSTGKTRSLWEAIRELGPNWIVIRPSSPEALRGLAESDLLKHPCVLWLDELQRFLQPDGKGLSRHILERIIKSAKAPILAVGTIWPDKFRDKTESADHSLSDSRDLLVESAQVVRIHDVVSSFSRKELDRARALAPADVRTAKALLNRDRFGFTQTLAGALELLELYNAPKVALTRFVLDAATDVRRLGHASPLPENLLWAVTLALWEKEHGPKLLEQERFESALSEATARRPRPDGVQALYQVGSPGHYEIADYLEHHATRRRHILPVTDAVWDAICDHTYSPVDLVALARTASSRRQWDHSEALCRRAAGFGYVDAFTRLAWCLDNAPGKEAEAEQAWRDAINAGDLTARTNLARWLCFKPGREVDAEQAFREAITAGDPHASTIFTWWLSRQPDRKAETEQAYRSAITAGAPKASTRLAEWLNDQPGRKAETEQAYRDAIAAGDPHAASGLAQWLATQPGRKADSERADRDPPPPAATATH